PGGRNTVAASAMTRTPHAIPPTGTLAERLVCAYLTWLPLLWVIGLVLPLATLLVIGLFVGVGLSRRSLAASAPWFAVGGMQLASVALNMWELQVPAWWIVKHVLASYVLGWFLLGGCVAIGASGAIRPEPFLRAAARIGWYCAAAALVLYPLSILGGERYLHVLTPIGQLLPVTLPSTSFFFGMLLYNWEELFGVLLPRLSFMFPWTTAMGFGGLCLIFVSANEANRRRRLAAMAGGLFMVAASMGRTAALVLAMCAALRLFIAMPRRWQLPAAAAGVALALLVPIGSTIATGTPDGLVHALSEQISDLRPSATQARDLVYEESWAGVYDSPLLGHGWPGEAVYPEDYPQVMQGAGTMGPGSHSTYLGLVYLGGLCTFAAFAFALVKTVWSFAAADGPRALRYNAIALLAVMGLNGISESLYALVVPTLFAFLWIGIALHQCRALAPRPVPVRAGARFGARPTAALS
ncbi:MAG: O-antigen ligase family protein, partial [Candidatus Binatia bacterium]